MIEFPDYPTVLMRMLNQCIREPHIYLAVFIMQPTGEGRLDFIQVWYGVCVFIPETKATEGMGRAQPRRMSRSAVKSDAGAYEGGRRGHISGGARRT